MPHLSCKFTILLSAKDNEKIEALKADSLESKGQIIRKAIRALYQMQIQHVPTCASGQNCFVPGMHPTQQMLPPLDPK